MLNFTSMVVSIDVILNLKVVFIPLEYVPTKPPPLSSYVINICFVLFKLKECPQQLNLYFDYK